MTAPERTAKETLEAIRLQEAEDMLSLSDEEALARVRASGRDPAAVAAGMRAAVLDAFDRFEPQSRPQAAPRTKPAARSAANRTPPWWLSGLRWGTACAASLCALAVAVQWTAWPERAAVERSAAPSAAAAVPMARFQVDFAAGAAPTVGAWRNAVARADGQVVNGPDAAGRYTVEVPQRGLEEAGKALRSLPGSRVEPLAALAVAFDADATGAMLREAVTLVDGTLTAGPQNGVYFTIEVPASRLEQARTALAGQARRLGIADVQAHD
jgi:hypothetical protein